MHALAAALLPAAASVGPTDPRLVFEGRWKMASKSATADWPCAGIKFAATAGADGAKLRVTWAGVRTRINATVFAADGTASSTIWDGPQFKLLNQPRKDELVLPPGASLVRLRKLTSATPYSMGIATDIFDPSLFEFRSLDVVSGDATIAPAPARPARRIQVIGASDSAGWCVDGTPNTSTLEFGYHGWHYSNCDGASGAELARRFDAELSVQALAGAGLTQNANAAQPWQTGKLTMADLYTRTLQTDGKTPWNASAHASPQLVLLSLGGNDYNHQNGKVPSNATFNAAYAKLLSSLFASYGIHGNSTGGEGGGASGAPRASELAVVSICGQGSPAEAKYDPDNNRCRPCPHVEAAVASFKSSHPTLRAEYLFVPCDGSVVTGEKDIGCNGHKNRQGQLEVADFLEPKLRAIMHWSNGERIGEREARSARPGQQDGRQNALVEW